MSRDMLSRRHFVRLLALGGSASVLGACEATPSTPRAPSSSDRSADVLVIGAGIAGLRAAEALVASGRRVIVIEARTRVGGRILTDRSWGVPVELGASWIHGVNNNPIAARAAAAGIATKSFDYESTMYGIDGNVRASGVSAALEAQVAALVEAGRKTSPDEDEALRTALERAMTSAGLDATKRLDVEMAITESIEHEYASDESKLSANHFDDGANEKGGDSLFPGGYDQLVNVLAHGLDIRLGHVVSSIDTSADRAVVETSQGRFDARAVVVTVPLGVLKSAAITFKPGLSAAKSGAVARLGMGALSKSCFRFPSAFWPKDTGIVNLVAPADRRGQWVESLSLSAVVNLPVLMMFNAGEFARTVEAMSEAEVLASASAALAPAFPKHPQPNAVLRSSWTLDPFSGGTYSFLAVGSSLADRDALATPEGRLFFAGEACSHNDAATVHGAYASGEAAAKAVLAG